MNEVDRLLSELPEDPEMPVVLRTLEEIFIGLGGDPEYLAGMKMAVPGAGAIYGVKVPLLRKLSKEILRRYHGDKATLAKIADGCWFRKNREHQLVALFILAEMKLTSKERWDLGERFLPEVNNWESCDQLCMALLGQALEEDPQYMDVIEAWLNEENIWVRRAALVAPVYLRRSKYSPAIGEGLDRRTLAMASSLLDDEESYIKKAVDWTVREVIKRHYQVGLDWMLAEARSKPSKIATSTLRLASKKLAPQDREMFLQLLEGGD